MERTINLHEAKTHFSKWVDRAAAGERIVIAKAGQPKALLTPLAPPKRVPGRYQNRIAGADSILEPLPEDELAAWEGQGRAPA